MIDFSQAIKDVAEVNGVTLCESLHKEGEYWQLMAESVQQYDLFRAHALLLGMDVGAIKEQPLTGLLLFRVYASDKEVDVKNDDKY